MKKITILFFILLCFFAKEIFAENTPIQTDKIDINKASIQDLNRIISVGPTIAQRIIDSRPFSSVDDLLKVKGIGPATLQKIKDQGLACVDCIVPSLPLVAPQNNETIYSGGVTFNEILPSPEGADEENELIEIYNSNNFDIDLSGWKIKDTEGTSTTFVIPLGTKIIANNFLVFKRPQTKISLNNSGDVLNLILPNNKNTDSISFTKAPLNQSYNKTISGTWAWSTNLTPGQKNIILVSSSLASFKTNTSNNSIKNEVDENLASLNGSNNLLTTSSPDNSINNPWPLFFVVLGIAIILATVILIIKLKIYKINK